MQEQAIAALNESEEIERSLSEEVREELLASKTQLETGKLLKRLNRTHRINRLTQVSLVATILLSVGLWLGGISTQAKAEKADNSNHAAVAQLAAAPQKAELDYLKLSANLESATPLQAGQAPGKQDDKEF